MASKGASPRRRDGSVGSLTSLTPRSELTYSAMEGVTARSLAMSEASEAKLPSLACAMSVVEVRDRARARV